MPTLKTNLNEPHTGTYTTLQKGTEVWANIRQPNGRMLPLPATVVTNHDGTLPRVTLIVRTADRSTMQMSLPREDVERR